MDKTDKYKSIISLPHHTSAARPHMSMNERAAQFSPFAALTGFGEVIEESERITDSWTAPDDEKTAELNNITRLLINKLGERPLITVTYFAEDKSGPGGRYTDYTGNLRWIDEASKLFVMTDGLEITMSSITGIRIHDRQGQPFTSMDSLEEI